MSQTRASFSALGLVLAILVWTVGCSNLALQTPSGSNTSADPTTETTTNPTTETTTKAKSSAKAITEYRLGAERWPGTITNGNIAVAVPYGTAIGSLVATFTTTGVSVTVGSVTQVSGVTAVDFTNPVNYVVKAEDGSTTTYMVRVTVLPSSATTTVSTLSSIANYVTISGQVPFLKQGSDMTVTATIAPEGPNSDVTLTLIVDGIYYFFFSTKSARSIAFGSSLAVGPHTFLLQAKVDGIVYSTSYDFRVQ